VDAESSTLLESECLAVIHQTGLQLTLDISAVDYVDRRGAMALRSLRRRRVEVIGSSPLIRQLMEEDCSP
jgi:anti-anti-sigma regulatory factor